MIARPTMTSEDMRSLREFLDSPAGKTMLGQINDAFHVPPMSIDQPDDFWRPSPPSSTPYPLDTEISNDIPPSHSRTFRPAHARLARQVSYFPIIIVTILSTAACAAMIGWFVSAALKGTP